MKVKEYINKIRNMDRIKLIIVILIIVSAIFAITSYDENASTGKLNFSQETNSKIELVKKYAIDDVYFPFEENNKEYLLIGHRISSYSDLNKSTMHVNKISYKNGNLIIDIEVNEVRTSL